jgi:ATP-binding cassette subfamily F protein 3
MRPPLIRLEKVNAGYSPNKAVLKNVDLYINPTDRIALLGANGNGKSTLIKLLSDRLAPLSGENHKSAKVKIGYFAQFQTDELDVTLTPFEILKAAMQEPSEVKVRAALSRFGFDKHKADTKVGELSGGEKARLLFCLMSFDAPHIMLLDEPTNHLDMDAREALMQALNAYTGAVILVSHDPHLVECVADQLWLVADGTCKPFEDDLDAYRKLVIRQRKLEREKIKKDARAQKQGAADGNDAQKRDMQQLEETIEELSQKKAALENEIADYCSGTPDPAHLKHLNRTYSSLQKELETAETAMTALIASL